jgi:hypothetical protein
MDASVIRDKSIVEYLSSMGHKYTRMTAKYYWYNSPLRTEGKPSFSVNRNTNKWIDRGANKHGSIIDLVMELERLDFKEACQFLSNERVSIKKFESVKVPKCSIEVLEVKEITDLRLISYISERCIYFNLANKYCKEVYYYYVKEDPTDQKILTGIGFQNNMGGYDIRSSFDKTSTAPKSFTKIDGDSSRYVLFEGFFSFLSALEHYKIDSFKYDTYILNGTGNINVLRPFLEDKQGWFYTDNDDAGSKVIEGLKGRDMRHVYKDYNDFNDLLCRKKNL